MVSRSAIKYFLKDSKKSVFIFYLVIGITMIFGLVINLLVRYNVGVTASKDFHIGMSGLEIATIIYCFVFGLCSFREPFQMMLQNGFSRKTVCTNVGIGALLLTSIMALIDSSAGLLASSIMNGTGALDYQTLLGLLFPSFFAGIGPVLYIPVSFLILTAVYFSTFSVAYFIAVLYYRMNRALKISFSIGVPVLFTLILPILDDAFLHGWIAGFVIDTIKLLIGYSNGGNPLIAVVSSACSALVFLLLSYLLSRRAVLKV